MQVLHTADLDPNTREAARALLYSVFDDMTEDDWEHSIGGIHALAWDGSELVGHGSVIQRRLLHGGTALRAGYVEGVGVRADRRRQGIGAAVMEALERVIGKAYEIGALGATEEAMAFYAERGWMLWRGPSSALTPDGIVPTPDDDGCIFVLPVTAPLDITGEITCDWRGGDGW